jgi:predicted nucleic acid-binding protein
MKRVLLDTNVYIDWLNEGSHEEWVIRGELVRHMSSVVLMELHAGATTPKARRAVSALARGFSKVDRLVEPSRESWGRAGIVLRQLRKSGCETRRASLVNDVLIALCARQIVATLLTRDVTDHSAIRSFVRHSFLGVIR